MARCKWDYGIAPNAANAHTGKMYMAMCNTQYIHNLYSPYVTAKVSTQHTD